MPRSNPFSSTIDGSINIISLYKSPREFQSFNQILEIIIGITISIALICHIVQTFWKNQWINRLLAFLNKSYSRGKFEEVHVAFLSQPKQLMKCHRFDKRLSRIPNANQSIIFILVVHVLFVWIIIMTTLWTAYNEVIIDCHNFDQLKSVLVLCERQKNPCNTTTTGNTIVLECLHYRFETKNLITTVSALLSWYLALRYLIIKTICFNRWIMFRDDDQPRHPCGAHCRCLLQIVFVKVCIWFNYISLWSLTGLIITYLLTYNGFSTMLNTLGFIWTPYFIAFYCILYLNTVCSADIVQNWFVAMIPENHSQTAILSNQQMHFGDVEHVVMLTKPG